MDFDASSTSLDEAYLIQHRIWRLIMLRREVFDDRTIAVIDQLIAESEERLERIAARGHSR
jgi:hypothetical protein